MNPWPVIPWTVLGWARLSLSAELHSSDVCTHCHSADVMTVTGPRPQPYVATRPYYIALHPQYVATYSDYTASHTPGTWVNTMAARLLCSVLNTYDNMCSVLCMLDCLSVCFVLFVCLWQLISVLHRQNLHHVVVVTFTFNNNPQCYMLMVVLW